jgi:hypothetical protein
MLWLEYFTFLFFFIFVKIKIARGECRVEVEGSIVGKMISEEIFGEISFLLRDEKDSNEKEIKATANVISDSEIVDVYVIDRNYLNLCFKRHELLEKKFYVYVAQTLTRRLRDREGSVDLHVWNDYRGRQHQFLQKKLDCVYQVKKICEKQTEIVELLEHLSNEIKKSTQTYDQWSSLSKIIQLAEVRNGNYMAGKNFF